MNNQEAIFKSKATQRLPLYIEVGGVIYKMIAEMLMGGGFRIIYGVYNGTQFDWNQKKLYDKIYTGNETDDDVLTDTIRTIGGYGNHLSEVEANHRFRVRQITTSYKFNEKKDVVTTPQPATDVPTLRKDLMARRSSLISMMKVEKDHDIKCELFGRKQELGAVILRLRDLESQTYGADKKLTKTVVQDLKNALDAAQLENTKLLTRLTANEKMGAKLTARLQQINNHADAILSITRL